MAALAADWSCEDVKYLAVTRNLVDGRGPTQGGASSPAAAPTSQKEVDRILAAAVADADAAVADVVAARSLTVFAAAVGISSVDAAAAAEYTSLLSVDLDGENSSTVPSEQTKACFRPGGSSFLP